jgi:serpin B
MSLVVLLPILAFGEARQHITVDMVKGVIKTLGSCEPSVRVVLPTFNVELTDSVVYPLSFAGIADLFNAHGACDLCVINDETNLYVYTMLQTVLLRVDVDEAANERTACKTASGEEETGPEKLLIVDRPFYYMFWDRRKQIPIVLGQLCDPRSHE